MTCAAVSSSSSSPPDDPTHAGDGDGPADRDLGGVGSGGGSDRRSVGGERGRRKTSNHRDDGVSSSSDCSDEGCTCGRECRPLAPHAAADAAMAAVDAALISSRDREACGSFAAALASSDGGSANDVAHRSSDAAGNGNRQGKGETPLHRQFQQEGWVPCALPRRAGGPASASAANGTYGYAKDGSRDAMHDRSIPKLFQGNHRRLSPPVLQTTPQQDAPVFGGGAEREDRSIPTLFRGGGGGGDLPLPLSAAAPVHRRTTTIPPDAAVFGVDRDLRVTEWNEYCIAITGYVTSEVLGRPFADVLVSSAVRDAARRCFEEVLEGGDGGEERTTTTTEAVDCHELEVRTKRGEVRVLKVNASPRINSLGKITGVIGVAQDVTDDKKLASMVEQMELSNKRKDEQLQSERSMTAYFSHECRNPLHSIDSALQAMPYDDLPESAKSLVNAMTLCTSFMSSIMNNLLDVRKLEEGKMVLNYEPMSLSSMARTVLEMLKPSVRPGVTCTMDVSGCAASASGGAKGPSGGDWVLADSHRLQQVLTNVVTNAIKYTTEGSVTLRVGWEKGAEGEGDSVVRFDCIDTGPGIPKSEQGRLFKRFVQRGGAPGSGLGLAIAKSIVDLGGGSIYFESDPTVRPGTTCVIRLPLKKCESPLSSLRPDGAGAAGGPGGKAGTRKVIDDPLSFLVIDDIEVNRTMLGRRLKRCIAPNAELIREARTGEEAIKIVREERFDVIVVDHHMDEAGGVMLGSDVAIAMRRMGIDDIIIGCSGDEPEAFEGSGCDLVWGKPMPPNATVVRQLSELLARRDGKQKGDDPRSQSQCIEKSSASEEDIR